MYVGSPIWRTVKMTAITPGAPNHEGLAPLASRFVNVDGLSWEPSQFPGIDFKTLLIEPDTGLLTALVRMAPGSTLPDHQHVQIEQTYVIDGSLVDEDGAVGTGQFIWRPAGSRHAAHAPEGALILGIFIKPNRFFDSSGDTTDMLGRDYDSTWC